MAEVSHFEEDRTIKVSGISELAKDVLTKHFQSESNSGLRGDVKTVYVCPDNKDYALIEFTDQGEYL